MVAPRTPTEEVLAAIWAEVLGLAEVGATDDFFALGGHSLLATQVVARARDAFGVDVSLQSVFQAPTIQELARVVDGTSRGVAQQLDVDAEVRSFGVDLRPAVPACRVKAVDSTALVTGATGYAGSHFLAHLLATTPGRVACLVRAGDADEAHARLERAFARYELDATCLRDRVVPLLGDVAGLEQATWPREVAASIEHIYHFAADTSHVSGYRRSRRTNVGGVVALLAAFPSDDHHFSMVSTLSVAPFKVEQGRMRVADTGGSYRALAVADIRNSRVVAGYLQGKWVAERVVEQARDLGRHVTIVRTARIVGSVAGAWSPTDSLTHLTAGSIAAGVWPDDLSFELWSDTGQVAEEVASAAHAVTPADLNVPAVLVNLNDVLDSARRLGYRLRVVPREEWAEAVRAQGARNAAFWMAAGGATQGPTGSAILLRAEGTERGRDHRYDARRAIDAGLRHLRRAGVLPHSTTTEGGS
jgi:thioester reductase-like protein